MKVLEFYLTTAVDKQLMWSNIVIPAGTTGRVIEIMIEPADKNHPVMFLLEFIDFVQEENGVSGVIDWYCYDEVEGCDDCSVMR